MNKRGVAWPQILEMILVLVVIATVTYIAFPNIFRDTRLLLNETATTIPSSKDFVPYVPDENMPQDLKTTHESILSLKFALESVAKDEVIDSPYNFKVLGGGGRFRGAGASGSFDESNNKATGKATQNIPSNSDSSIGYTCSKDKDNEKLTCTVKNFELPQAKDELGTDGWKGWIAEGIGDPKYVLFYEQLPQGVEKSWAVDKYRLSNKWLIASGVMNAIPGAWAARHFITGGLPKHLLAESIKTASEKIGKETTEQALKESAERGEKGVSKWMSSRQAKKAGKKASKEFANDVKKDLMPNSVAQFLKNLGENNAKLSAEEIARKELTRDFLFRHFGRESLDDIPYDEISESFIKNIGKRLTKEEAEIEVDGFFSTKVDDAGSTLAEKLSKNILPDDISQAGAVMQRKHAVELDFLKLKYSVGSTPEDFAKADWFVAETSVLKKKFGYLTEDVITIGSTGGNVIKIDPYLPDKSITKYTQIKSLDDIADENLKAELRKETEELAEKLSKDRAEGKIDDTLSMIARDNIVNVEMSKVKRNLVTESQILSRLSQRQLKTLMSYKQMFTSFVENAPDGTLRINREFLSDTLEEAAKNAYPKNPQLQEMLLKNFDEVSPMIFNSRGRFMETVVLDNVGEDAAEALEKDFLEASMETVKQSVNLKNIMKGIWINAFGKAEGETGWEKFISWARNQVPYSREAAERFGGGGILGAIGRTGAGYGVGYAIGGEEGAEAGALAASMPGVTVGSVKWLFQHRYATAALIWWQASKIEAMNEKYEAQGINTLAVSTPYVIDNSKLFQLNDVTNDYYIALILDDKWYLPGDNPDIERFFMASPCKAELVITKAACACEVMTDDDVMKITTKGLGGEIPLIKGTAQSDESLKSGPGDTYIRYLTKANSDLSHAVKTCNYNPSIDTNDFFDEIYQGIDRVKSGVTGIFTDNDNVGTVTAPCLKVKAKLDDDYKKTNGANFCYPSSDPTDEVASAAVMIGFGIVDAGVTVAGAALAPETLGLSLIAVPIVHFTTGVLSDISLSVVAHKWPDRG